MKIACLSFTDKGKLLGDKLQSIDNKKYTIHHYENKKIEGGIKNLLNYAWKEYDGLVFISATGIAVRIISPFIEDKTIDPAIVVIDDTGNFAISLLSGHIGGANELARWIGTEICGLPVITTATDNRNIESIDIFAKKNNYHMEDMASVTNITSMMVNGKILGLYTEEDEKINYNNLIRVKDINNIDPRIQGLIIVSSSKINNMEIAHTILRPKNVNVGIGCRKSVGSERIIEAIKESFNKVNLSTNSIKTIGTVEVKKNEEGIIQAANHFKCPMKIFSIEEIKEVEDKFEKSQFVKDTIGVYSVSEASAYLLGGKLVLVKSKHNGITISISKEI